MAIFKNVGPIDRGLRVAVGIVALVLAFTQFHVMSGALAGITATAIGIIMLLTAAIGMCPLYLPLKLSTCKPVPK